MRPIFNEKKDTLKFNQKTFSFLCFCGRKKNYNLNLFNLKTLSDWEKASERKTSFADVVETTSAVNSMRSIYQHWFRLEAGSIYFSMYYCVTNSVIYRNCAEKTFPHYLMLAKKRERAFAIHSNLTWCSVFLNHFTKCSAVRCESWCESRAGICHFGLDWIGVEVSPSSLKKITAVAQGGFEGDFAFKLRYRSCYFWSQFRSPNDTWSEFRYFR